MRFADFVRRAAGGDTSLYLSSQPQRVAADGHPEVLQPPLAALRGDVPLVPALAGHLVPQQLNLWMGASLAGARASLFRERRRRRRRRSRSVLRPSLSKRAAARGRLTRAALAAPHPETPQLARARARRRVQRAAPRLPRQPVPAAARRQALPPVAAGRGGVHVHRRAGGPGAPQRPHRVRRAGGGAGRRLRRRRCRAVAAARRGRGGGAGRRGGRRGRQAGRQEAARGGGAGAGGGAGRGAGAGGRVRCCAVAAARAAARPLRCGMLGPGGTPSIADAPRPLRPPTPQAR